MSGSVIATVRRFAFAGWRMLLPRTGDSSLDRPLLVVRGLYLLVFAVLVAVLLRHRLIDGMPDMVPSSSRRRSGPDVTWADAPVVFTVRFLMSDVFVLLLLCAMFGVLTEWGVRAWYRTRPRVRTRYPH